MLHRRGLSVGLLDLLRLDRHLFGDDAVDRRRDEVLDVQALDSLVEHRRLDDALLDVEDQVGEVRQDAVHLAERGIELVQLAVVGRQASLAAELGDDRLAAVCLHGAVELVDLGVELELALVDALNHLDDHLESCGGAAGELLGVELAVERVTDHVLLPVGGHVAHELHGHGLPQERRQEVLRVQGEARKARVESAHANISFRRLLPIMSNDAEVLRRLANDDMLHLSYYTL